MNTKRTYACARMRILTSRLRAFRVMEMQIRKLWRLTLITVLLLTGVLVLPDAISWGSSLYKNATIYSHGTIVQGALPLHVDGRWIKDSMNDTVILRGVNKGQWVDHPTGCWMETGSSDAGCWSFSAQKVIDNLDYMLEWGCNVIRLHTTMDWWIDDYQNFRYNIKTVIELANERGIYVIFEPCHVRNYQDGGGIDDSPLPWTGPWTDYCASIEDFVDYWRSVVDEMGSYPNVIYELWNEPHGDVEDWYDGWQQCIDMIRNEKGDNHIILIQWYYGQDGSSNGNLNWVQDYPFDQTNLAYSTHVYRGSGAFNPGTLYEYDDVKTRCIERNVKRIGEEWNKPLIIGETGQRMNATEEYLAFKNFLTIMNEWNIGYVAWLWRSSTVYALLTPDTPFPCPPSPSGQTLIDSIAAMGT